jgi:hypothetical protein
MRTTRRELATAAIAATLARNVEAQAAPDLTKQIHDANQRNSDTLTKFEIPISTEPAFRFEA